MSLNKYIAMKVLWLGSIILPRIAETEQCGASVHNGWLIQLADIVSSLPDTELLYLFPSDRSRSGYSGNLKYIGLPETQRQKHEEAYICHLVEVLQKEQPDVLHIWGAEFGHSYPFMQAAVRAGMQSRVVVSVQGLLSVYAKDYTAFLPHSVVHAYTLNSLLKGNIRSGQKDFEKRGEREQALLKLTHHIIGRTDWDKAAAWSINPAARYHHNDETLREPFYSGVWSYERCEKHSLFCSQSHYPIKGLHLILQALALVKRQYPDVVLYVGGEDVRCMPFWRMSSYRSYLKRLMRKLDLEDQVKFTGFLTAEQMKERYLRSNVFVSASSIENSSNSIGEAMLLGTPVVSSCVGGIMSLMEHGKEGLLYPASEVNMLAHHICTLFADPDFALALAQAARHRAAKTHDGAKNAAVLMQIYREIAQYRHM